MVLQRGRPLNPRAAIASKAEKFAQPAQLFRRWAVPSRYHVVHVTREVIHMRRLALLAAMLVVPQFAAGCATCDAVDDYCGSYSGGVVGEWPGYAGRAGSAYGGVVAEGDAVETVEAGPATY
jgi:hypothetical protein